jgi:hypothetical protein
LLVDEFDGTHDFSMEPFEVIEAKNIGVPNFKQAAFRFDILEFNTNVKPSFIKYLFDIRKIEQVIYFDPDIYVYSSLSSIYFKLIDNEILLTPHILSPIHDDGYLPTEKNFLVNGTYNLGFIALRDTANTRRMLDWWEDRCLKEGFVEGAKGLFVDQKWINLVPSMFDRVQLVKDLGWNMAYWNLHERMLSRHEDEYLVNQQDRLLFFHFSGIKLNAYDLISKNGNRYDLMNRPDLRIIFDEYRERLKANEFEKFLPHNYTYECFTNGDPISTFARRLYSVHEPSFRNSDPFIADGRVHDWCKKHKLLGRKTTRSVVSSNQLNPQDWRVKLIHFLLKFLLRMVGPDRYMLFNKYLSYISIMRNQSDFLSAPVTEIYKENKK